MNPSLTIGHSRSIPLGDANLRSPAFMSELRLASPASSCCPRAKVARRSAKREGGLPRRAVAFHDSPGPNAIGSSCNPFPGPSEFSRRREPHLQA